MKNESINALIGDFLRRTKLYRSKFGDDEFWNLSVNLYTNELKDWHDFRYFPEENEITKERKIIIVNILLDAIGYMSNKDIKEQAMKKSELKALIREVIEKIYQDESDPLAQKFFLGAYNHIKKTGQKKTHYRQLAGLTQGDWAGETWTLGDAKAADLNQHFSRAVYSPSVSVYMDRKGKMSWAKGSLDDLKQLLVSISEQKSDNRLLEIMFREEPTEQEDFDYIIRNLSEEELADDDSVGGVVYGFLSELQRIDGSTMKHMEETLIKNGINRARARQIILLSIEIISDNKSD